ncbi:hypothetical protein BC567DRAFT_222276 [Phyllosticta citribraziliensis]
MHTSSHARPRADPPGSNVNASRHERIEEQTDSEGRMNASRHTWTGPEPVRRCTHAPATLQRTDSRSSTNVSYHATWGQTHECSRNASTSRPEEQYECFLPCHA